MLLLFAYLLRVLPYCPAEGTLTSEYGFRKHPVTQRYAFHQGIDIANVEGTPIRAPWDGEVVQIKRTRGSGLYVVIQSGSLRVVMRHFSSLLVQEGDLLAKGAVVGYMGHSGRATGDHLHLEIRKKRKTLNPAIVRILCQEKN